MKHYNEEFRSSAVRLVLEEGQKPSKVAKDLGVSYQSLVTWMKKYEESKGDTKEAFPGKGKRKPSDHRLAELEKENRVLKMERDLLKKTMGFFVPRPQ